MTWLTRGIWRGHRRWEQCSQQSSPSGLFPNLPRNFPPRTRAPWSPGEMSHICRPVVTYSPRQSPAVSLLSQCRSHQQSPSFLTFFNTCFMHQHHLYYDIVSLFLVFFLITLVPYAITRFGLIKSEVEMQPSRYQCRVGTTHCPLGKARRTQPGG